jgi:hypothetical protein
MWVIDRFEGDMAVVEYQSHTFNVPKKALPSGTEEGDFLSVSIDQEGTDKVQGEIDKLKEQVFE